MLLTCHTNSGNGLISSLQKPGKTSLNGDGWQRGTSTYNVLITGLQTFQDCEYWLADFGSRTFLSLLSLVPASAVSGNKLKESREHLAKWNTYRHQGGRTQLIHMHTHTQERVREGGRKDKNMEICLRHLLKICNYIYIKLYIYVHINFIYIYKTKDYCWATLFVLLG